MTESLIGADLKFNLNPEAIFGTLADLISIHSVNPNYPGGAGEWELAEYIGQFFKKHSIEFEFQPVSEKRPNVVGKMEGRPDGRTLILEAHMDTASELGMTVEPFDPVRKGNRMYGRGSCDTKGGLAAMLHALKLLRDSNVRQAATVFMAATVDEEYSFQGVAKFLEKGIRADGAIVAEPTDLKAAVASKGVLRWRLLTRGRAAHSAKLHLGLNAVSKMAKLIVAMEETLPAIFARRQHPLLGSPTLNVGTIRGGIQVNQVPESCVIEVDRRLLPGETREQVWGELMSLISRLQESDPDLQVEMGAPLLEDLPFETSSSERIVQVAERVSRTANGSGDLIGVPYGSDASKFSRAGIPSIIWGPGSIDRAHAAEEYVELDQVALATEMYARTILEF